MAQSNTQKEIFAQPSLWRLVAQQLAADRARIDEFLAPLLREADLDILFDGCGLFFFVGEMAMLYLRRKFGRNVRSVATTDFVTHAPNWLRKDRPTLVISFARSGNSPESVATVELIQKFHPSARHLILTCNREGQLARLANGKSVFAFLLPDAANDQGLAMTGSVTGMLLTTLLLCEPKEKMAEIAEALAKLGESVLEKAPLVKKIAERNFDRIVCLGSGPFLGLAREAHLKVQEMSDGTVIGKWDSFLGFRHGPRAVVQSRTLMLYFLSPDPHVALYEKDLVQSVQTTQGPCAGVAIRMGAIDMPLDLKIELKSVAGHLSEDFLSIPYLLVAQLLAFYKCENLGLHPDSPSKSGAIHRVVQGVTIYPWS